MAKKPDPSSPYAYRRIPGTRGIERNTSESTIYSFSGPPEQNGLQGLRAGYDICKPDYRYKLENPWYNVFLCFCSGTGYIRYGDETFQPVAGDIFLLQKGRMWDWYPLVSDPFRYYWLNVDGPLFQAMLDSYHLRDQILFHHCQHVEEQFNRIFTVMQEPQNRYSTMTDRVAIIIMEICQALSRSLSETGRQIHPYAHAMRFYMNNHYMQDITNRHVAGAVGISVTTAVKVFTDSYGESPMKTLRHIRMLRAAEMLINGCDTVEKVADRVGFCNPQYFARQFRMYFGMSPTEYRRVHGNFITKRR